MSIRINLGPGILGIHGRLPRRATNLQALPPLAPSTRDRPWERQSCPALVGSPCVQVYESGPCARCGLRGSR